MTSRSSTPTWIVVFAIILLAVPALFALRAVFGFLWAFGIVGVLAVAAVVTVFIWAKRRIEAG